MLLLSRVFIRTFLSQKKREKKNISDGFGGFISKDFISLTSQFGSGWFANPANQLLQV